MKNEDVEVAKKRLFVWGWHRGAQAQAIETFCDQHDMQVVQWLRNDGNRTIDRLIHRPFELEVTNVDLPHELVSKIAGMRVKFMDMYSRVTISQAMSYADLNNIFWLYVKYFEGLFSASRPDVLLMGSPPHFGADYVMYELARLHGIKTKVALQTLFSNRFLCVDAIHDLGVLDIESEAGKKRYHLEDYRAKTQFYMKSAKTFRKSCVLSFIRNVLVGPHQFKPVSFEASVALFKNCRYFKRVLRTEVVKEPDLSQKYVYFPLQLQPEMTTSMLGGDIYSDQILALEVLHSFIPDDWKIYVKENPKQTPRQRSCWFYQRLRTLEKVEYLDVCVSSSRLIEASQFVSAITGTAGWEALLARKGVLGFGYAWYNALPGVFHVDESPNLEDILNFRHDPEVLEERFNALMGNTYEGVVDEGYKVIVEEYSDEENARLLVKSLEKVLL